MPIKLQKYDIANGLDNPMDGYMILGFDQTSTLVYKNSDGVTLPVIPMVATGTFQKLDVDYLTVGYRISEDLTTFGLYSISQGINNLANNTWSSAHGENVESIGVGSTANGNYVSASGDYSYAGGVGLNSTYKLYSSGVTSFVHSYATADSGTLSDYSVILGGMNHKIGTGSDYTVILGGIENTISNSITSTAVIACRNTTATLDDAVYVPRLVLSDSTGLIASTVEGTIEWDGTNFKGYDGSTWINFSGGTGGGGVSSVAAGNGMTFSTITATGSVTMGTPSSITTSSSNSVSSGTHSHLLSGYLALSGGTMTGDLNVSSYNITGATLYLTSNIRCSGITASSNITATGNITAYYTSDRRLKQNINPLTMGLDTIAKLKPVTYNWNDLAKGYNEVVDMSKTNIGLIAQDLEEVIPELIHGMYNSDIKGIDYIQLIPVLIQSIKELKLEVDELKNKLK